MEYTQFTKLIAPGDYDAMLKDIQIIPGAGTAQVELVFEILDGSKDHAIVGRSEQWPSSDSQLDRMVDLVNGLGIKRFGLGGHPISSLPVGYRFRVRVDEEAQVGSGVTDLWCEVTEVLGLATSGDTGPAQPVAQVSTADLLDELQRRCVR